MSHSTSLSLSFLSWKNGNPESPPTHRVDGWIKIPGCHQVTQRRHLKNVRFSFDFILSLPIRESRWFPPGNTAQKSQPHTEGPFPYSPPNPGLHQTGLLEGALVHKQLKNSRVAVQTQLQDRLPHSPLNLDSRSPPGLSPNIYRHSKPRIPPASLPSNTAAHSNHHPPPSRSPGSGASCP